MARAAILRVLTMMLVIVVLLAGSGNAPASAGPNLWTDVGPRGLLGIAARDALGNMYAVPTGRYDSTFAGRPVSTAYRSTDGGQTWSAMGDFSGATGTYNATPIYMAAFAGGSVLVLSLTGVT